MQLFLSVIHEHPHRPFNERNVSRASPLVFEMLEHRRREVHRAQDIAKPGGEKLLDFEFAAQGQHREVRGQCECRAVPIDVLVVPARWGIQWHVGKLGVCQGEEECARCVADGIADMREERIIELHQAAFRIRVIGCL